MRDSLLLLLHAALAEAGCGPFYGTREAKVTTVGQENGKQGQVAEMAVRSAALQY